MYRVEKLTPSKHVKNRFYLDFAGGGKLTVTLDQIADYSIFTGRELTDEEFEALSKDAADAGSRARALRILGERSMSRREITERLMKKGDSEETASGTADWLERIGAVNDAEYARLIVRHYSSKGYGAGRVRDELYRRGIDRELWEDAMAEMPDMDDRAYALLCSRLKSDRPDRAELKRASDALLRRGFSWEEIKSAVNRFQSENGDH